MGSSHLDLYRHLGVVKEILLVEVVHVRHIEYLDIYHK